MSAIKDTEYVNSHVKKTNTTTMCVGSFKINDLRPITFCLDIYMDSLSIQEKYPTSVTFYIFNHSKIYLAL